jgi:RNA polymerase sigma-70 factor, ECF subfamily
MGTFPDDDAARFKRMYQLHVDRVYRYALRRSPADAEEVVSETFLVAWRRMGDVPADALPWLLGIARRILANRRRGDRRRTELTAKLAARPPLTPPDPGEVLGQRSAVMAALKRLPERDRELLLLLVWDELDHAAIGHVLGCSTANVAVRLHRARRRLARELEREAAYPASTALTSEGVSNAQ